MSAAVRFENLSKRFGTVEALAGATLQAPAGSIFALVGPNGAGKTTAIKTMLNIFRPTRGRAEILGVDSRRLQAKNFEQIGYVSENQQLPEWMTAGYFLSYCKAFYPAWTDGDAAALVQTFELPLERPLRTLSRGMKVKAAIVASLAYRPRLLILDEPFSGLDVLVRDQLISSILEREMTVFVASHDMAEIESFASHVAYLTEGRILFTEELSRLNERFREVEAALESGLESPRNLPPRWLDVERAPTMIRFIDPEFERARTESEVRSAFAGVREISVRSMPLRSIFVALAKSTKRVN